MSTPTLDPVIHAPKRLQLCAFLVPLGEASFPVLREELGVSDSVLSKHIKQLEEADYVKTRKDPVNGRRQTWIALTRNGRKAFSAHVKELQRLAALADG